MRLLTPFLFAACIARAAAANLPARLSPPAPFPHILAQSFESGFVAPGVRRADYRLATASGPLTIELVAVDLHEPSVRLGDVVAGDHLVSAGEPLSSMALRTHAVAGINADYFDIGQTNAPLGIVVQDGTLLRTPSRRSALDVRRDGSVHFDTFSFRGSARFGTTTVPLDAVNVWPPRHGAVLLTPAFGPLPQTVTPDVTLVTLAPLGPLPAIAGDYRVLGAYPATPGPLGSPTLALGAAALAIAPPPAPGDVVTLSAGTDPPLAQIADAVGGGPLLVRDGAPFEDPDAPAPEETYRRFPVAGAALTPDGTLLLIVVDGRDPARSVGLTRPEFGALMRGLGAAQGMAFDSGGSATLVERVPGDAAARVANLPSDGEERPVADGLFVYSDAPPGPPARLALRPSHVVALRGAHVHVTAAIVDAAGHLLGPAPSRNLVAERSGIVEIRYGSLRGELHIRTVDRVARLQIGPERPNPDPGGVIQLQALAADASGREIDVAGVVRWSADRGTFLEPGLYRASARDAIVTAAAGAASASTTVLVGRHAVPLESFGTREVRLEYDFTGTKRFAYDDAAYSVPGDPLSFSIDVDGDDSGVGVRAAFVNRFGERTALTLAQRVVWRGWRRCTIAIPGALNPPLKLVSLYVVNSLGTPPVHAAGTIGFRNPSVMLPGER
jgi:hypothetical protein